VRCFFQADDGGLSAGITDGIISCLGRGPLAGVGIIMGAPHDARAVSLLAARENIALSVHLNLLEGHAVAPLRLIPPLVGKDGLFRHSLGSLAAELFSPGRKKKRLLQAIETEFRAQIERFIALAPERPLRLDSHLHVHVLPPLRSLLLGLVREYRASYVRVPAELFHLPAAPLLRQVMGHARRSLLARWAFPLYHLLAAEGVASSDFFVGAFASGFMTLDRLRASLRAVSRKGTSRSSIEIMVHPGGLAAGENPAAVREQYRGFYAADARTAERNLLVSPALTDMLASLGAVPYFPAVDKESIA
jgi:predicted glycoside hydrolase/deacetylase ChbG (UPF0249 family)